MLSTKTRYLCLNGNLYKIVSKTDRLRPEGESIVYQRHNGKWRDVICLIKPETAIEYVRYKEAGYPRRLI
jgi:hypothetical protein